MNNNYKKINNCNNNYNKKNKKMINYKENIN